MANTYLANAPGSCSHCGQPIEVGQPLGGWARDGSGRKWHANCLEPWKGIAPAPAPIHIPVAAPVIAPPIMSAPAPVAAHMVERYVLPEYEALEDNAPWWRILQQVIRVCDVVLMIGPPGSGKSQTAINALGIRHRVTITPYTGADVLYGVYLMPEPGRTVRMDGPVVKGMQEGSGVLFDEINRIGGEGESLCYQIFDNSPHCNLASGELIHAEPGFKSILTSNHTLESIEPAIVDRIQAIIMAYEPHPDALAGMREPIANLCRNYYKTITVPKLTLNPTVRRSRVFDNLLNANMNPRIAANVVFGTQHTSEIMSVLSSIQSEGK